MPEQTTPDLLERIAALAEGRVRGYAERQHGGVVNGTCADGLVAMLPEIREAIRQQNSTTGDKYRAELYDEVWQQARGMGYLSVSGALGALAQFDARERGQTGSGVSA